METVSRAREPDVVLWTLPRPAWVECPRCDQPARVDGKCWSRLNCGHCGFAAKSPAAFIASRAERVNVAVWTPRCGGCGQIIPYEARRPTKPIRHGDTLQVQHRCPACGRKNVFRATPTVERQADATDPSYGLPLFLREDIGEHVLWAYNRHHIELLATWLGASLRERSLTADYQTMIARLPRWMKLAAARPKVMRALDALRAKADRAGLP